MLLVGDGPELERCRVLAKRSRLGDRVIFAGMRLDVKNLYPTMDVFFLSSIRGEGWSGVLREAMVMSLPCIAVEQDATRDQLQNGNCGLLLSIEFWIGFMQSNVFMKTQKYKLKLQSKQMLLPGNFRSSQWLKKLKLVITKY